MQVRAAYEEYLNSTTADFAFDTDVHATYESDVRIEESAVEAWPLPTHAAPELRERFHACIE